MADFPTFPELLRIARAEALTRNPLLRRREVERQGSDIDIALAGGAGMAEELVAQLAKATRARYISSALGKDLDRLVFDLFGIIRKSASPAYGEVQFTTTSPVAAAFNIGSGTQLQTSDGKQFITVGSVTFPAASSGPVTAIVRSALAGSDQQAASGRITSILSVLVGAPSDLSVTNALATAGADDEETDDDFRARARDFFLSARRGTVSAIRNGALSVPGVRKAYVFEDFDLLGRPGRDVQLIITDAFTDQLVGVTTPATYIAQSQAFARAVSNALDEYRAAGVGIRTIVAQVVIQSVTLSLRFRAGVDTEAVSLSARSAVMEFINSLPPNTGFSPSDLVSALRYVDGLVVTGSEVISPTGAIVPTYLQVLRTTLQYVSVV